MLSTFATISIGAAATSPETDVTVDVKIFRPATRDIDTPEYLGPIYIQKGIQSEENVTFMVTVTNVGPMAAEVRLYCESPSTYEPENPVPFAFMDQLCLAKPMAMEPGEERIFFFVGYGLAPGWAVLRTNAVSDITDTDPSNNVHIKRREVVCDINGTQGDDVLRGTKEKREAICGGAGDDRLRGIGAHDRLFGGKGNDFMWGDKRFQNFVGGAGRDIASFKNATRPVWIYRNLFNSVGWGYDTFYSIEGIIGTRFGDWFDGRVYEPKRHSAQPDWFWGAGGDDHFIGGRGLDRIFGGPGDDLFRVRHEGADVIYGGKGDDRATVSFNDKTHSAARTKQRTFQMEYP